MTFVSTMVLGPSPIYPIMKELDVKQGMYLKDREATVAHQSYSTCHLSQSLLKTTSTVLVNTAFPCCSQVIGCHTLQGPLCTGWTPMYFGTKEWKKEYFKINIIFPFFFLPTLISVYEWTKQTAYLKDGHCLCIRFFCKHPLLALQVTSEGKIVTLGSLLNLLLQKVRSWLISKKE